MTYSPKCSMARHGPPRRYGNELLPSLFSHQCLVGKLSEVQYLRRQCDGEKAVDHRVDLLGHFQLAEMTRPHGLAVQYLREHLMKATHVRARLWLVGGHVEAWHRQPSARFGGIVVARALDCRHNHMLGGGGHLLHDALLALLVVAGYEQDIREVAPYDFPVVRAT